MLSPDNLHSLDYCTQSLGHLFLNDCRIKIKESGPDSERGGRLNLYKEVKKSPSTVRYVANIRTVGGGGCWLACEWGVFRRRWRLVDTSRCHIGRGCASCVTGERWRTGVTF